MNRKPRIHFVVTALLLLAMVTVAHAQTTGFITTRPSCVPPNGTTDPINYIQGADPITYGGFTSGHCTYAGMNSITWCP